MLARILSFRPPIVRAPSHALRLISTSRSLRAEIENVPKSAPQIPEPPPKASAVSTSNYEPPPFDPSVPPKSLLKPGVLDVPHTHPVALLHFRTYYAPNLEFFLHFAYHAALALNIPLSHPARLPTQRSLFTVPKSPFIFKKAQENFERKTHKRAVKVWNAHPDVVNVWLRYLEEHMMPGVGMRVVRWERCPVGIGEQRLKEVGGALREVRVGGESVAPVGERIKAVGEKIVAREAETAKKALVTDVGDKANNPKAS